MNNENPYQKDDKMDYKLTDKISNQLLDANDKHEKATENVKKKDKQLSDAKSKLDSVHQDFKIVYLQAKIELLNNDFSDTEAEEYLKKYLSDERYF